MSTRDLMALPKGHPHIHLEAAMRSTAATAGYGLSGARAYPGHAGRSAS